MRDFVWTAAGVREINTECILFAAAAPDVSSLSELNTCILPVTKILARWCARRKTGCFSLFYNQRLGSKPASCRVFQVYFPNLNPSC